MSNKIKTVSTTNQEKYETEVNELLAKGWVILSCNCSAYGYDGQIDEMWQAVLFWQDLAKLKAKKEANNE